MKIGGIFRLVGRYLCQGLSYNYKTLCFYLTNYYYRNLDTLEVTQEVVICESTGRICEETMLLHSLIPSIFPVNEYQQHNQSVTPGMVSLKLNQLFFSDYKFESPVYCCGNCKTHVFNRNKKHDISTMNVK